MGSVEAAGVLFPRSSLDVSPGVPPEGRRSKNRENDEELHRSIYISIYL